MQMHAANIDTGGIIYLKMLKDPWRESFCRHFCPHLEIQKDEMRAGSADKLPLRMCPKVAAVAVRAMSDQIASNQPGLEYGQESTPAEDFIKLADQSAERFDEKATRCARNMLRRGTANVTLAEVQTVTDTDITELIGAINTGLDHE